MQVYLVKWNKKRSSLEKAWENLKDRLLTGRKETEKNRILLGSKSLTSGKGKTEYKTKNKDEQAEHQWL